MENCYPYPQAEGGQSLHTQESGDAGLSSNMVHTSGGGDFQAAFLRADAGISVTLLPEQERHTCDCLTGKVWSVPSSYSNAAPTSLSLSFEKTTLFPSSTVEVYYHNKPEGKTESLLTKITTTEERPIEEDRSEMAPEMGPGETRKEASNATPPVSPGGRRADGMNSKSVMRRNQRHVGALLFWLSWIICTVRVSDAAPAADIQGPPDQMFQCYTCMDKQKCPNLTTVYDKDDNHVFQRVNEKIPPCAGIAGPAPERCVVCSEENNIHIICSDDVGPVEVEQDEGETIKNISHSSCPQQYQQHPRKHYGIIASVIFVIVGALLSVIIYSKYSYSIQSVIT
ncbi:uncharacterized protein [Antennarius striatus]|uniref:uncharacterized protein n=1 Tax=Antennarius striatus TaxID=241820 RepID=UPI0035AFE18E